MSEKLKNPIIVGALALLCCFLWGSAFPSIKLGYEWQNIEGTGSQLLFAGYRFCLAGLFTLIIGSVLQRKVLTIKISSVPAVLRQGLLQTTLQYFFFYIGLAHTTGTNSSIINGSNGLFAILAAHVMMQNDRLNRNTIIGCVFGFAGILVLNLGPEGFGTFSFLGEGMVLLCALMYGISSVTLKQISHLESPIAITAYQLLLGSVVLIVSGLVLGGEVTGFTPLVTVNFIYLALLSTASFTIWSALLKYNSVSKISIYSCSIPLFGTILSGLLLGEDILKLRNLIALVMITLGIYLANPVTGGREGGLGKKS